MLNRPVFARGRQSSTILTKICYSITFLHIFHFTKLCKIIVGPYTAGITLYAYYDINGTWKTYLQILYCILEIWFWHQRKWAERKTERNGPKIGWSGAERGAGGRGAGTERWARVTEIGWSAERLFAARRSRSAPHEPTSPTCSS